MNVRRATRADLDALVELHAAAFVGQMGPLLGPRYLRGFLAWFQSAPGAVSLVAELDGRLAGYVFGAPDGYGPRLSRELLPEIARGVLTNLPTIATHPSFVRQLRSRAANLVLRREPASPIFAATPAGCFCLVGIGTAEAARGKGVGRALIEAFAAATSPRAVILDVFRDNAPARALYERSGFLVLAEDGRVLRMIRAAEGDRTRREASRSLRE